MNNNYIRVASASPLVEVGNVDKNYDNILSVVRDLNGKGVDIVVFPEMCLTGYTCAALFHNQTLIDCAHNALHRLSAEIRNLDIDVIVGLPKIRNGVLKNCAAFLHGKDVDIIEKTYLPDYNEFYEKRWFRASQPDGYAVFETHGVKIGVEICEDLWSPVPPSCHLAMGGAELIFNLSASDDTIGKYDYLYNLVKQQSARCICGYVYASSGWGESSTDLVFSPKNFIAENGTMLQHTNPFAQNCIGNKECIIADIDVEAIRHDRLHNNTFYDCAMREGDIPLVESAICLCEDDSWDYNFVPGYRYIDAHPFVPASAVDRAKRCSEILFIQMAGLVKRLSAIGCKTVTLGISGGLDSTLALLVVVKAFDSMGLPRKNIVGVTMPGFGTTGRTYNNAVELMKLLGVTIREVPIREAVLQHFHDIGHDPSVTDVTYENSQARERTQILMDIANQNGGIVVGTGDLSELALGWATYNGDHMSMYGVNAGIPKTLVKYLVSHYASESESADVRRVLSDIVDTPISPELTPASDTGEIKQKTENLVGPYELHDFYLYYVLRYGFSPKKIFMLARKAFSGEYDEKTILHWLRIFIKRFFAQQFKRSCLPDGPKVGSVCLSPRGDWRMPSDASSAIWLAEIDSIPVH